MKCENLIDLNSASIFKGNCPFANVCDGTGVPPEDCRLLKKIENAENESRQNDWGEGDHPIAL